MKKKHAFTHAARLLIWSARLFICQKTHTYTSKTSRPGIRSVSQWYTVCILATLFRGTESVLRFSQTLHEYLLFCRGTARRFEAPGSRWRWGGLQFCQCTRLTQSADQDTWDFMWGKQNLLYISWMRITLEINAAAARQAQTVSCIQAIDWLIDWLRVKAEGSNLYGSTGYMLIKC